MRRVLPIILIIAVAAGAGIYYKFMSNPEKPVPKGPLLRVTFLNARLGNAIIMKTPEGRHIIVDPGPASTADELVTYLQGMGVKSPTVILTNPSTDHTGALPELMEAIPVARIIRGEFSDDLTIWERAIPKDANRRVAEVILTEGGKIRLSKSTLLEVLSPPKNLLKDAGDSYDNSLVARVIHGNKRFLLTSDIGLHTEAHLIGSGIDITSDILVVPNHGRKNSASLEFISSVRPECFVVMPARGRRPNRSVLDRIDPENTGAEVCRTDREGIVEIVTDGRYIAVSKGGDGRG